jgi:hypothetical protein
MRWGWSVGLGLLLVVAGCGDEMGTQPESPGPTPGPTLSEDLSSHCFRWPEAAFTRSRYADVSITMGPGETAVDFELADVEGTPYRLSDLLADKPVLLVLGSFT